MLLFSVLRLSVGRIDPISYINTTVHAFGLHCFCILLYCGGPPLLYIRVCTPQKKCEPCHSSRTLRERSLFKRQHILVAKTLSPLYFPAALNLNTFTCLFHQVFLFPPFCADRKEQRARHTGKIFTNVLCSGHICEPSVGRLLSLQAFGCFQGAAELAPRGYLE